jgi:dTDP-4-dehydrorhamnose reductase
MRAFITGSKGQLGAEFVRLFESNGWDYAGADIDTLDLTNADAVQEALMNYRPSLILNCAAYNMVDMAEADSAPAYAVNVDAVRFLARAAMRLEAKFVHFGTDYVFDGTKGTPYDESDVVNPLNHYGRSKLKGEECAFVVPRALVFRLSWVYGRGTQNFMHKLLGWAKNPAPLRVADDETSVPTGVVEIVSTVMGALKVGLGGRWHLTASGHCSRYDWASTTLRACGVDKEIVPARMADFNLPAPRPLFSAMSNAALCRELGIIVPHWQEAVETFIGNNK